MGQVLLKACLNGDRAPGAHPALPVTAQHVADDVVAVAAAGAGAVHVHVKGLDGSDSLDSRLLADTLAAISSRGVGLPVGVTTGAWALPEPAARTAAITGWTSLPAFASVNWHEDGAEDVAAILLERGVGVEAGLWHIDAVKAWLASPVRERCLRVLLELPDGLDPDGVEAEAASLLDRVRAGIPGHAPPVLLHGEGSSAWPALRCAAAWGLDARIGLEDTLVLPDGSPAPDNAALVRAAREVVDQLLVPGPGVGP